jgi:hypothetical protein
MNNKTTDIMKKLATTTLAILFIVALAPAQSRLQGPRAKNFKPWMNEQPVTPTVIIDSEQLSGPAAKNFHPWEADSTDDMIVVTSGSPREGLTGPAAKNFSPWMRDEENESPSEMIAVVEEN